MCLGLRLQGWCLVTWAKVDTGIHWNPKVRRAGREAREVYLLILLANAEQQADGEIAAHYADPDYLADCLQCSPDEARNGVKRCETFQLLHVTDESVRILGWDEEWRTKNSTDRVRKYRARKRAEKQRVEPSVTDETLHVTGCNGETPKREREDREIRERDLSPDSPGAGVGSDSGGKKRNPRPPKHTDECIRITDLVIARFNDLFNRNLGAKGYRDQVKKLLAKGYTENEIRGVIWWASMEWADDEEWRMKVDPSTVLKLQNSQGSRNFPQYLALATELWFTDKEEPCPWMRAK